MTISTMKQELTLYNCGGNRFIVTLPSKIDKWSNKCCSSLISLPPMKPVYQETFSLSIFSTVPWQGATDQSLCVCLNGQRLRFEEFEQCILCGPGLNCTFGNGEPEQLAGFWVDVHSNQGSSLSVYRCRNALECPAGQLGTCAPGRSGRACNNCKAWHRKNTKGQCEACSGVDVLLGCTYTHILVLTVVICR